MTEDQERNADAPGPDGDLPDVVRAQLRPAAESLREQFGGDVELAEQAVLACALELTKDATVFQYASVLAARRARQRLRDTQTPEDERARGGSMTRDSDSADNLGPGV